MTKENVNQCFKFEHNKSYAPLIKVPVPHLEELLKTRLNFSFPEDVHIMDPADAGNWYCENGVNTAIDALNRILYGNQAMKKAESKSKGKGKGKETENTPEETDAISRFSPLHESEHSGGSHEPGPSSGHVRKAQYLSQSEQPARKRSKPSDSQKPNQITGQSSTEVRSQGIENNQDVDMDSSPSPPSFD